MREIILCSLPTLDLNYDNVIDFPNPAERDRYIGSTKTHTVNANVKYDTERTSIVVKLGYESLYNTDYCFFSRENKKFFYFITNKTVLNEQNTELTLSLDVWTTYMFDYVLRDSFVDRAHVDRWNGDIPRNYIEEEGLEFGEHIIQENPPEKLFEFNNAVIVVSSTPLGEAEGFKVDSDGGSSGGDYDPGDNDGTEWQDGKLSAPGFRFIKGFEGMAYFSYKDSGGYDTIGYGVTKHGEPGVYADFEKLSAEGKLSEEVCAKMSYELKHENYGRKIIDRVREFGCNQQAQFDALLSVAFNCGYGVITGSTSLSDALKKDHTDEATIRPIWENFRVTSGGGPPLAGLIARRKQECNMYFGKDFEIRPIQIVKSGGSYPTGTVKENNGNGWLPESQSGSGEDPSGYKTFDNDFGSNWLCPVKGGTVSSKYGMRTHPVTGGQKMHHGTDIGAPAGTPYVACDDGEVLFAGWNDGGFGNLVTVKHRNKYKIHYPHLSKINVKTGDNVKRGQKLGEVGTTGTSTGNHVHWEMRRISDNQSTDPAPKLKVGDKV